MFSEPGVGHSEDADSRRAVRDFGVQEADIEPTAFMDQCHAAGFAHVALEPFARVVPGHGLTPELWRVWSTLAAASRPRRALTTIRKGLFEMFGLRKDADLLHGGIRVGSAARPACRDAASPDRDCVEASVRQVPEPWRCASPVAAGSHPPARCSCQRCSGRAGVHPDRDPERGHGPVADEATRSPAGACRRSAPGRRAAAHRSRLREAFAARRPSPGEACVVAVSFPAPVEPAPYAVKIDLVAEGVNWFETMGTTPAIHPLVVTRYEVAPRDRCRLPSTIF